MGLGWRKAFCTSIPKDRDSNNSMPKQQKSNPTTPKLSSKFSFFSSSSTPSTPRLQSQPVSSPRLRCRTPPAALPDLTPKLQCKTSERVSNPSSPRSPSTFSLLKSINALRLSKHRRCGLCLYSVKSGQGTAIFTAECNHTFHFPCVASHVRKQGLLTCPVCNSHWTDLPPASVHNAGKSLQPEEERNRELSPSLSSPRTPAYDKHSCGSNTSWCNLKVYNDDEPLMSPKSGGLFNPIPESDEINEDNDDIVGEFQGFFPDRNSSQFEMSPGNIKIVMMPESAVVSVSRGGQTCVIGLKVIAPPAPTNITRRAPIDLVAVIDVSVKISKEKIQLMKKVMKLVVCSMTAADRLSIVAFSTTSKRLLPLKRMTAAGRRTAHRIIRAIVPLDGTATLSAKDALKKAVKVLEDRRERNPVASILLLSNSNNSDEQQSRIVSTTRLPNLEIPVHRISLTKASECCQAPSSEEYLGKYVERLLCLVVQDLRIQLGVIYGSAPGEIAGVYSSSSGGPVGLGSGLIRVGDLYAEEEREILVELKVPSMSSVGDHRLLSVRTSLIDPSTQKLIQGKEQAHLIPRPLTVRSSSNPSIERLRRRFIITRAVAESRRLVHKNDLAGAYQMLSTARALLLQSRAGSGDEFLRSLEIELSELQKRRQKIQVQQPRDEKLSEPLTPTSAWRAAERLAKVAMMRKSLNRVSDLHGFENARF